MKSAQFFLAILIEFKIFNGFNNSLELERCVLKLSTNHKKVSEILTDSKFGYVHLFRVYSNFKALRKNGLSIRRITDLRYTSNLVTVISNLSLSPATYFIIFLLFYFIFCFFFKTICI